MVEASTDRPANMPLHGQLAVEEDTEVADDVRRLNSTSADLENIVIRFQLTQRSSGAEPDELRLRNVHAVHGCTKRGVAGFNQLVYGLLWLRGVAVTADNDVVRVNNKSPVSYTHLTLPTIYSV